MIAYATGTIYAAALRAFPLALIGLGLTLTTLARFGPINIG